MTNQATVTLLEKMQFRARTGSGHALTIDSSADTGGENAGPRPMELQLAALAGCAAMDVISILRKMRQDVTSYEVSASGETQKEHPKKYTRAVLVHRVTGLAIGEANVRRAVYLSMARYCPVFAMLAPTVEIVSRYEISDPSGALVTSGEVDVRTEEP